MRGIMQRSCELASRRFSMTTELPYGQDEALLIGLPDPLPRTRYGYSLRLQQTLSTRLFCEAVYISVTCEWTHRRATPNHWIPVPCREFPLQPQQQTKDSFDCGLTRVSGARLENPISRGESTKLRSCCLTPRIGIVS